MSLRACGVVAVAGAAVAGLEGDPLLDGADRVEVLVELAAVVAGRPGRAGRGCRRPRGRGRSGRRRPAAAAGLGAEEAVEGELGVDLAGDRRGRARPGDVRAVEPGVADVGVDAGGHRLDAELERGQRGQHADPPGGELVDRHAAGVQVGAGGPVDRGAGQPGGVLDVMAVAGERAPVAQAGQDEDVVLVPGQGLEDGRELVVLALPLGGPGAAGCTRWARTGRPSGPAAGRRPPAAAAARAPDAGRMASSSGRPTIAPAPRSTVRRVIGRFFRLIARPPDARCAGTGTGSS